PAPSPGEMLAVFPVGLPRPRGPRDLASAVCRKSGSGFLPNPDRVTNGRKSRRIVDAGEPAPAGTAFVMSVVRHVLAARNNHSNRRNVAPGHGPSAAVRSPRATLHVLSHSSRVHRPLRRERIPKAAGGSRGAP